MLFRSKPCPFCGATPKWSRHAYTSGHGEFTSVIAIKCQCGCSLESDDYAGYMEDARKQKIDLLWNRRAAEPAHTRPADGLDVVADLKRAFHLGQTYWQQADHEFISQQKKADTTKRTFDELVAKHETARAAEQTLTEEVERLKAEDDLSTMKEICKKLEFRLEKEKERADQAEAKNIALTKAAENLKECLDRAEAEREALRLYVNAQPEPV